MSEIHSFFTMFLSQGLTRPYERLFPPSVVRFFFPIFFLPRLFSPRRSELVFVERLFVPFSPPKKKLPSAQAFFFFFFFLRLYSADERRRIVGFALPRRPFLFFCPIFCRPGRRPDHFRAWDVISCLPRSAPVILITCLESILMVRDAVRL